MARVLWVEVRASSRETVAGWTLKRRAAAAAVFSPSDTIFRTSDCCCGESLGRRAAHATFLPGGLDADPGAFPQHGALELREGPHHVHQHPAGRRRRVDRLGHALEAGAGFPELLQEREHVAQRARQPIQLPHHDDVPGAQVREELEELGPVPPSAGRFLAKDARAPRRG